MDELGGLLGRLSPNSFGLVLRITDRSDRRSVLRCPRILAKLRAASEQFLRLCHRRVATVWWRSPTNGRPQLISVRPVFSFQRRASRRIAAVLRLLPKRQQLLLVLLLPVQVAAVLRL